MAELAVVVFTGLGMAGFGFVDGVRQTLSVRAMVRYSVGIAGLLLVVTALSGDWYRLVDAVVGACLLGSITWIISVTAGMGRADVRLAVPFGAALAWQAGPMVAVWGFAIGCVVSVVWFTVRRVKKGPFIPGLAAAYFLVAVPLLVRG